MEKLYQMSCLSHIHGCYLKFQPHHLFLLDDWFQQHEDRIVIISTYSSYLADSFRTTLNELLCWTSMLRPFWHHKNNILFIHWERKDCLIKLINCNWTNNKADLKYGLIIYQFCTDNGSNLKILTCNNDHHSMQKITNQSIQIFLLNSCSILQNQKCIKHSIIKWADKIIYSSSNIEGISQ